MVDVGTAVAYLQLDASAFNSGLANVQSSLAQYQNNFSSIASGVGSALTSTGTALTAGLTVPIANAAKSIITFGADFDKQMSAVRAVMGDISEEEFQALRNAAIQWGEKTVYTATEAGEALYYMGLAGWSAEQAINGLGSVLNLAAAGQMDLGRASDVVTDSMTAMNLMAGKTTNGIENTAYYTSVLAAVMANSNTDVDKLGESFKYVAPLAGQLGFTIEDLGLALGLAANAGIKSSQAGTSLRQALKQLIDPTEKTQGAMDKYGISLFDASGQAVSFRDLMIQLQKTFGDLQVDVYDANGELKEGEDIMTEYGNSLPISQQEKLQAVVQLFGTRALPTMLAVIQQAGDEFYKLADAIDNAAKTGEYAADMAKTQLDNLSGDWTKFTSALGTTKIKLESIFNDTLRKFIQSLTDLVRKFNDLDTQQQKNILKWAAIAAAIGPVMTIMGRIMVTIGQLAPMFTMIGSKIGEFVGTLTRMRWGWFYSAEEAGGFIGKLAQLGSKANWIIAIIVAVISAIIDLWKNSEQFRVWVKDAIASLMRILGTLWNFLQEIFKVVNEVWNAIVKAIEPLVAVLVRELSPALDAILNVLKPILDLLIPIFQFIGKIIELVLACVTPIINGIAFIVGAITRMATAILEIIGNIRQTILDVVMPFFDMILGTISSWVDAVVGFFADLKYQLIGDPIVIDLIEGIKSIFEKGLEFVKKVVDLFVNKVVEFFKWLKETATNVINNMIDGFKNLWQSFYNWLVTFGEKVLQIIQGILNKIRDSAQSILNAIRDIAIRVWNSIVEAFEKAKQHIREGIEAVKRLFEELRQKIAEKFEQIKQEVQRKFEDLKQKLENLVTMIRDKFAQIIENIKQRFSEILGKIKEFGTKFVEAWKTAFANVQRGIATVFNNIRNGFTSFGEKVVSIAKTVGNAFVKGLLGTGRNIKEFFTNFIKSAVEGLLNSLRAFKETGALIMQNLWNGIKEKWSAFTSWLKEVWNSFIEGNLFSKIGDKISSWFMNGRTINGSHANGLEYVPFNGYVAELHKGERVLTAEENKAYSSGMAGGTTINFYSPERIDEYTAARELRRTIHDMELGLV